MQLQIETNKYLLTLQINKSFNHVKKSQIYKWKNIQRKTLKIVTIFTQISIKKSATKFEQNRIIWTNQAAPPYIK